MDPAKGETSATEITEILTQEILSSNITGSVLGDLTIDPESLEIQGNENYVSNLTITIILRNLEKYLANLNILQFFLQNDLIPCHQQVFINLLVLYLETPPREHRQNPRWKDHLTQLLNLEKKALLNPGVSVSHFKLTIVDNYPITLLPFLMECDTKIQKMQNMTLIGLGELSELY